MKFFIHDIEVSTKDHQDICLGRVILNVDNCNSYCVVAVTEAFKCASRILSREFDAESIQNNIPGFADYVLHWCQARSMLVGDISITVERGVV